MELSFDLINSFLVHPYKGVDDPKLHKNIQAISQNFTTDRDQIKKYVESDELVSAYTAFYFPTNFVKLRKLFEHLPPKVVESFQDYDVIDVGSGPGTYAAAFLDYFPQFQNQLYLLESSKHMTKQAEKVISTSFPAFSNLRVNKQISGEKKRLMIFGNSLNEMGAEQAQNLIESNRASVIIFIEPGTPQAFKQVLKLRDHFLKKNFQILYPCPNHQTCPIKETENWCHQIFHEVHHPSIESLSQIIRKDRRALPVTVHVYSRDHERVEKQAILFRVLAETKFSFNFEVCENNLLKKIEVMKKNFNKSQQKIISSYTSGDSLSYEFVKEFPDFQRVQLHLT